MVRGEDERRPCVPRAELDHEPRSACELEELDEVTPRSARGQILVAQVPSVSNETPVRERRASVPITNDRRNEYASRDSHDR
jgi:hypothetical protein